jgi:hypothetical protein
MLSADRASKKARQIPDHSRYACAFSTRHRLEILASKLNLTSRTVHEVATPDGGFQSPIKCLYFGCPKRADTFHGLHGVQLGSARDFQTVLFSDQNFAIEPAKVGVTRATITRCR